MSDGHTNETRELNLDHHAIDVDACDDGIRHDWQPINTPRGRAYRCERCWDRTD